MDIEIPEFPFDDLQSLFPCFSRRYLVSAAYEWLGFQVPTLSYNRNLLRVRSPSAILHC